MRLPGLSEFHIRFALLALILFPLVLTVTTPTVIAQDRQSHGVYVKLIEGWDGSFDAAVAALREEVMAKGWELLADYESGVDRGDCPYRAHVFVVHSPRYAQQVLRHGPRAAFALPLRLAVFQDENGIHVGATNPLSLNRTIIAESGFESESREAAAALKEVAAMAFNGAAAETDYGQMRDRGLISKTMGLIAGGPFEDKIETAASVDGQLGALADRLYDGLENPGGGWKWEIRPVYRLDLMDLDVVIIGVTGEPMEAKAFQIVAEGSDEAREDLACPGIDHAPAFPIELVLAREEDDVNVLLVDEMFRMKMYFEDAGKMKFAANMRMPGSIENEIRDKIDQSIY